MLTSTLGNVPASEAPASFSREVLPDGRIMLIPMAAIPKHQLWAWYPENQEKIRKSLRDPRPSIVVETEKDVSKITKRWTDED
ncbi:MAG: SpoVT/AbrB protein [Candidatus Brocadiaceae bacterium]|nr:SpoVT/AbrB protein [Candidatus Brocadiaceae bacterium]